MKRVKNNDGTAPKANRNTAPTYATKMALASFYHEFDGHEIEAFGYFTPGGIYCAILGQDPEIALRERPQDLIGPTMEARALPPQIAAIYCNWMGTDLLFWNREILDPNARMLAISRISRFSEPQNLALAMLMTADFYGQSQVDPEIDGVYQLALSLISKFGYLAAASRLTGGVQAPAGIA